ncbi:hypothetical protein [Emticicia sp.]|uniref:hypothetical protein n=1 Tax=Emticicia sp. TaxID=1930953 RepID=UPI003751BFE6
MKKILAIIILCFFYFHSKAQQTLAIKNGAWSPSVTTIGEAGNDYISTTIQSSTTQTQIDLQVVQIAGLNHYTVYIRRTDSGTNWNTAGLQIWVRRTSDGSGAGAKSTTIGGTTYQQITTSDLYFFEGNNDSGNLRTNIGIQYQITGVSVTVPVATYSTTLTYTLIDD